jgi:hypothetical protein
MGGRAGLKAAATKPEAGAASSAPTDDNYKIRSGHGVPRPYRGYLDLFQSFRNCAMVAGAWPA